MTEVLPAEPVPKTTTWNRRARRSALSSARSARSLAWAASSRTCSTIGLGLLGLDPGRGDDILGRDGGGGLGAASRQSIRAEAAAVPAAERLARATNPTASQGEVFAIRSCISPTETTSQAVVPMAIVVPARASPDALVPIHAEVSSPGPESSASIRP